MMRRSRRQALVRIRLSVRGLRRRLQPYRVLIACVAGGLGAVLGAVYEDVSANLRIMAIVAIGVLTAIAVLLTEQLPSPHIRQRQPVTPSGRRASPTNRLWRRRSWRRRSWWHPWRRRVVPSAPSGDGLFRGRDRELAELMQRHREARRARDAGGRPAGPGQGGDASRGTTGPILLLIHGKPGVGKSALALELARRLAHDYPHGQVYANLGTLGRARGHGAILKIFLDAIGWPADEIPAEAVERGKIFRSVTAKRRMLFILDAARYPQQVLHLLPSDPRCAVIVTSRRDLGPELKATSFVLDVPDIDEAITILRAASETDDGVRPECAVEIVELCGRLPLALRAAAERTSLGGTELCHTASLLKPQTSRLSWLERPGTSVAERVASQYERLLDQEQRALQLLTLVESSTFVPWVLAPLLYVRPTEAENIMIRLNAAQMLDNAGRDDHTGLARYAFHPLVRLYAQARLRAGPDDGTVDAARKRLDEAYREAFVAVLSKLDPTFQVPETNRYLPSSTGFVWKVVRHPEPWIRAEYPNLLRRIKLAQRSEPELCWRLAAWLDGCVPPGLDSRLSLEAFESATAAADETHIGLIKVLLAKGSFLMAIERYGEAEQTLNEAADRALHLRRSNHPDADTAARHEVLALRKLGEGYLQMASLRAAAAALRRAFNVAVACGEEQERELIRVLLAETHQIEGSESILADHPNGGLSDARRFRAFLVLSESARRRADWDGAHAHLAQALAHSNGDARRGASVQYRMARLYLYQHLATNGWPDLTTGQGVDDPELLSLAEQAVRRAAAAGVVFRRMDNRVGVVRSHCLLARALLAAGYLVEAERAAHTAAQELAALDGSAGPANLPLTARVRRVMGDLMICRGDLVGGRRLLLQAATLFGYLHDWAAESEALRRLRDVRWHVDGRGTLPVLDDAALWSMTHPDADGFFGPEPETD
jgi:NB-ARC domain